MAQHGIVVERRDRKPALIGRKDIAAPPENKKEMSINDLE
jgi:hypothetical protein